MGVSATTDTFGRVVGSLLRLSKTPQKAMNGYFPGMDEVEAILTVYQKSPAATELLDRLRSQGQAVRLQEIAAATRGKLVVTGPDSLGGCES